MNQEFIPYEEALALKELGFDEPCFGAWAENELFITEKERPSVQSFSINQCTAPLFQQAFRWFRDKDWRFSVVCYCTPEEDSYYYDVWYEGQLYYESDYEYTTYEETELACLNKLIEIAKQKQ